MANRLPYLVLMSLILLYFTVPAFAQEMSPQAPPTASELCRRLMALDAPNPTGPDAPSIRIVNPAENSTVYGSQMTLTVETENFDISTESGDHWHLWLNSQLQVMVYEQSVLIDVQPGTYWVCAIMGDKDHADLGEPSGIMVTVAAAAAGTPTSTPLAAAQNSAAEPYRGEQSSTLSTDDPMGLILIIGAGLVAAVGGWWLGAKLPKKKK